MPKSWIVRMAIVLGLFGVIPVQAADGWYAFLYHSATRQVVRVGLDGTQETFDLGLGENTFLSGYDIAASADGSRIAYCASSAQADSPQSDATLIVRDLVGQTDVLNLPLGASIGCRVSHASLKADASQVAVSLVKYYPGSPDMDTEGPVWRLLVVDVASGSILSEINAESVPVVSAGVQGGVALLPEVRSFANNQVIFAEIPYGIGGAPEWNAFVWHLDSGVVEPDATGMWGKSGLSVNPASGEIIWLDQDPARPAADPGGPIPAFNVVRQADSSGTVRTIYYTGDWVLNDTAFVNGGAQLGVLLLSPFDPNHPDAQQTQWIALNRDGTTVPLASGASFSQIADAPGGFVLFELIFNADFSEQLTRLSLVTNGAAQPLWESQEAGWEFAHTTPMPLAGGLPAFPAL